MRNHHHQQTATERAIDTAGNRCQSLCGTHPATAATSVSSSAPGATLTPMSAATAGGTVIMLDDDLSSLQASHAKLPPKQQKHQHPNKLAAMSSATTNNNNNNHSEKVKITSNSVTKYTTVTLPSLLANHRENTANTMLHVNRKQFTPTSDGSNASFSSASVAGSIQDDMSDQCSLTQAGLEEYNIRASSYYDQPVLFHHQKQSSYAQSEGYHSYVSSSDSSSATPFLDRLRQESDLLSRQSSHNWSQNDLSSLSCASIAPSPLPTMTALMQDSGVPVTGVVGDVVNNNINNNNNNNNNSIKLNDSCSNGGTSNGATTINIVTVNNNISGNGGSGSSSNNNNNNANNGSSSNSTNSTNSNHHHNHNSSESTSSTETLKWLGSTSDISEASHATGYSAISESVSSSQLIVHSSRVLTPKRHHSESVLYLNDDRPCSPPLNGTAAMVGSSHHGSTPQETPPSGPAARGAPNHRYSPSYPPVHTIPSISMHQSYHQATFGGSMKGDSGGSLTTLKHVPMELGSPMNGSDEEASPAAQGNHKSSISVTLQPGGGILQAPSEDMASKDSVASSEGGSKPLTVNTAATTDLESPATSCNTSPSGGGKNVAATSYRSNHRLFPVSTYTEPVHSNTSHYVHHPKPQYSTGLQKPAAASVQHATAATTSPPQTVKSQLPQAPQASWQSVAALINDFERTTEPQPQPQQQQQPMPPMQQQQPQQQQQKYAFIEPTKTHRVSNPALKAIQKNAVQSYFERQQAQQQQQQHSKDSNQLQQQQAKLYHPQATSMPQLMRPHSYQPVASGRDPAAQQALRNSLPSPPAKASPSPPQKPDKPLDVYGLGGPLSKPPSPGPPPPPPRSRSLMPTVTLLRRSSSASDYGEFRDQYMRATQEKLQAQSVKNISSAEKMSFNDCGMPPPPPPPRGRPSLSTRRTSSASEYAAMRDKALLQQAAALAHQQHHPQQHNGAMRQQPPSPQQHYYYAPPAPGVMPHEGWVPERPPKNPNMRIPSPEPPPPPPAECDASLSDEPLPPPPPEILNRPPAVPAGYNESGLPSPSSVGVADLMPNRRNSFAGSSTRKALFMRATSTGNEGMVSAVMKPPPPAVPKKPNNSEMLQLARPSSSLAQQQSNKAHKVVLNGGAASGATSTGAMNRKRAHANPALMSMPPPILEHHTATTTCKQSPPLPPPSSSSASSATAPPPLMPRMTSITQLQGPPPPTLSHHASKQRCNSKASYLPRQSLEKLNSNPDHGSYKLTLTSNEDYVSSPASAPPSKSGSFDSTATTTILTSGGNKLPHNLPDVLPLGAKLQTQPSSPTAVPVNGPPSGALRYGSNNNLSAGGNSPTQQHSFPMYPPSAHRYSTPAMSAYHNIGTSSSGSVTSLASSNSNGSGSGQYPTPPPHYNRSQSYDVNRNPTMVSPNGGGGVPQSGGMHSPSKLMSQSTMDLKRVHSQLEPTLEECHTSPADPNSPKVLAPAQSENNLHSAPKLYTSDDRISEKTPKEGRIFRAECVNTTLVSAVHKAVTRKESLRENIEKITQLQSKLMSAHVGSDSGLLMGGNFAAAKAAPGNTRPLSGGELDKMPHVPEVTEASPVVGEEPPLDDDVPDTPPPPPPPLTPPPSLDEDPDESLPATTATAAAVGEAPAGLPQQISQMDSSTDGLKLMQRSEIVLRLNPGTSEVSCQTDDLGDCDYNGLAMPQTHKDEAQTRTTLQPRRPHPIELDCDNMSRDLVALLAANDKLIAVLTPQTVKTPTDYVSNLYNPNVPLRPGKRDVGTSTLMRMKARGDSKADSGAAVYQFADIEVTLSNGNDEDSDESDGLKKKVDELIRHINRKIRILNNEQTSIGEESALNDELGSSLVSKLADKVRPIEASKCRTFIDDVGYITSLLLSLSERLARTENSLSSLSRSDSEKKILESKRDRLLEQLEEAKHLKEDIDRRGAVVSAVLEKHLTDEDFADFDYFINMKAKLIADSRDIADKIKSGEEQLNALSEALIQSDC